MAFTVDDLTAIEEAIATGAKVVHYSDRRVEYNSLDDLLRARDMIRQELGLVSGRANARYASFSKGLC